MNAAKKGFRSPSDFVNAANDAPDLMHVDPTAGVTIVKAPEAPDPEAGKGAQDAPAAPQTTNAPEPAQARAPRGPKLPKAAKPADDEPPAHTHKRATDAPPEPPAPAPAPWDVIPADAAAPPFNLRLPKRLHAKIAWVAENVPKHRSMHAVCEKAVTAYVEALLAQHYKPEE